MKINLTLSAGVSALWLTMAGGAIAQQTAPTLSEQTLRDTERSRGAGSLFDQGGGLNMMQLIHNANLRGNTTEQDFRTRQTEAIDNAVDAFRKRRPTPAREP